MYTTYFGFREDPFSVTPDPGVFYTNPLYQEALATMRYGIAAKKGFIVITGPAGTGKTTLLRTLMRNLEATIHSIFIFNSHVSFIELLRLILHDLGLAKQKKKDKSTMIEQLNNYLIEQVKKGHIVSLLVDEAQNLSNKTLEGLRLLSNLDTDKEKLLQIVLMGQPELERKLDRPGLRELKQRVALQCRLTPLKEQEVGSYIDLRLQAAGYKGEDLFDPDTIEQIALYSRGIPRLINIICDNALLIAYATSQKRVSVEMVKEVAHDLPLGLQIQAGGTETSTNKVTSGQDKDGAPRASTDEAPQHKPRRPVRVGVWTSLLLLLLGGAASVIYTMHTKNRFPGLSPKVKEELIGERSGFLEDNPYKWLATPISRAAEPEKIQTPAESESVSEPGAYPQGSGPANPSKESLAAIKQTEPDEIMGITVTAGARSETKIYRVKEGDHLYRILRKQFGIGGNQDMHDAVNRVKELNLRKKNWDVLFVGEVLVLPGQVAALPRSP